MPHTVTHTIIHGIAEFSGYPPDDVLGLMWPMLSYFLCAARRAPDQVCRCMEQHPPDYRVLAHAAERFRFRRGLVDPCYFMTLDSNIRARDVRLAKRNLRQVNIIYRNQYPSTRSAARASGSHGLMP